MKIWGFVLLSLVASTSGLKCYVCTISAAETSNSHECVQNPGAVTVGSPTVDCAAKYCTITRQEYKNPPGKIASFYRGCENNPVYHNTMIEDEDFKTYFRSCSSDLCNTGNGIQSVSNGNLGQGGGSRGNLLIPGMGNSAYAKSPAAVLVTISSFVLYCAF